MDADEDVSGVTVAHIADEHLARGDLRDALEVIVDGTSAVGGGKPAAKAAPAKPKPKASAKPKAVPKNHDHLFNSDQIRPADLYVVIHDEIEHKGKFGDNPSPMPLRGLVYSNINSGNHMIEQGLKTVITEMFRIERSIIKENKKPEEADIESINVVVQFTNVEVKSPVYSPPGQTSQDLTPAIAQKFHLTYSAPLHVNAVITARAFRINGGEPLMKVFNITDQYIGKIPIMKGTRRCHTHNKTAQALELMHEDPSDPGTTYVIDGQEWVISMIENVVYNRERIYRTFHEGEITRCEFISKPGEAYEHSYETIIRYMQNGAITIDLVGQGDLSEVRIPFYIIFRLLGAANDQQIIENIVYPQYEGDPHDPAGARIKPDYITGEMLRIVRQAYEAPDKVFSKLRHETNPSQLLLQFSEIISRVSTRKRNLAEQDANSTSTSHLITKLMRHIDQQLLPHVGQSRASRDEKMRYLGRLIHKMFLVEMRVADQTNRDGLDEKNVHGPGHAFMKIIKKVFSKQIVSKIAQSLVKDIKNNPFANLKLGSTFEHALTRNELENELAKAIKAGKKDKPVRGGQKGAARLTSEVLVRKNQLNTLSTCRVVRTNNSGATKQAQRGEEMRQAHPSYAGFIDMIQSADTGEQVGMVRTICLGTFTCESSGSRSLKETLLEDTDLVPLIRVRPSDIGGRMTAVYVNGSWLGCTYQAPRMLRRYLESRRCWEPEREAKPAVGEAGRELDRTPYVSAAGSTKWKQIPRPGIDSLTSLYWDTDKDELHFMTDNSRLLRPLLIVRNNGLLDPVGRQYFESHDVGVQDTQKPIGQDNFVQDMMLTKADIQGLLAKTIGTPDIHAQGKIEYISPAEGKKCVIAGDLATLRKYRHDPRRVFTHVEIGPCLLGLPALTCPWASHNQAPRVIFVTNQSKQACGIPFKNYPYRSDKHTFMQYEVSNPIVNTLVGEYLYPNGAMCVVAIGVMLGENQEDSVAGCKTANQRGLFRGIHYNCVKHVKKDNEKWGRPDPKDTRRTKKQVNYNLLDEKTGLPKAGTILGYNDPVIGVLEKEIQRPGQPQTYIDNTLCFKYREPSMVDGDPVVGHDQQGMAFAEVKFSSARSMGIGEKLSSRSG
jgi:DNA-directed RNA polymerase beta subunit